ncbi:unnamed protein product [Callosobruchus maculatus]|uniref:Major facilitator superfamily (MFS) profile domain-containing protein n=1 Tax=Callosobruchus maculatus TaxID=64391 RepID=A0A653CLF0_CALMS|nr:unnamed protein product [Callosobruchus maculatus]
MVYTPTILVCGFYFERYRALATAISVTGTSIGIMAFPIIVNNVFHDMEWRMEFKILAASFGMIVLLVLTFRPIKPTRVVTKKGVNEDLSSEDEEDSIGSFNLEDLADDKDAFTLKSIFQNFHNKFFPTVATRRESNITIESKVSKKSGRSAYFGIPGAMASESSFTRSVFRGGVPDTRSVGLSTVYETDDDDTFCCCCCHCCRCCKICRCKRHLCEDDFNRPLYKDDIFFTGSVKTLPEYQTAVSEAPPSAARSSRAVRERASVNYALSVSRVVTHRELMQARRCVCCPEAVLRVLSTMLDLKLMKQLSFTLLVFSGFLTMVGMYSPFVFIGQRGEGTVNT